MTNNVVAIVVTYNRKNLLVRCIDALLEQTNHIGKIVIVDNASTDGTKEVLEAGGYLQKPSVDYHFLPENIGGAGGFNKGMQLALSYQPKWLWLMDDDGWPDKDCLAALLTINGAVRGPLVIDDQDSSKTSFAYRTSSGQTKDVSTINHSACDISPVHPFNGVLISTDVISKIGLPDARFFIWGDEIDYRIRWRAAGFSEKVQPRARFFHPTDRQVIHRGNKWSIGIPLNCSQLRRYCFYRNQTYLHKKNASFEN